MPGVKGRGNPRTTCVSDLTCASFRRTLASASSSHQSLTSSQVARINDRILSATSTDRDPAPVTAPAPAAAPAPAPVPTTSVPTPPPPPLSPLSSCSSSPPPALANTFSTSPSPLPPSSAAPLLPSPPPPAFARACSRARSITFLASSTPQDDTGGRRVVRGYADRGFERVGRGGSKPACFRATEARLDGYRNHTYARHDGKGNRRNASCRRVRGLCVRGGGGAPWLAWPGLVARETTLARRRSEPPQRETAAGLS